MVNERLRDIIDALVAATRQVVADYHITEAEIDAAGEYLTKTGAQGQLVDYIDLMLYTAADDLSRAREVNPNALVEGPRYKAGAPVKPDGVLYEGDIPDDVDLLKVSGRLYDRATGKGVEGAQIDFWHARVDGEYDLDGYDQRGKILTGADGRYEFNTFVPGVYKVHDGDLVETLMAEIGRTTHRARHIHLRVWIDGEEWLTSQFYDPNSPYIDTDMLHGSVRPELISQWDEVTGDGEDRRRFEAVYDIALTV